MTEEEARELLELAAKAAGITLRWQTGNICLPAGYWNDGEGCYWNPFLCDGDALRLAVNLLLNVNFDQPLHVTVIDGNCWRTTEEKENDTAAATRRAIVRAAAQLGRSHP